MSAAPTALRAPIDPACGGVLLANMLESWLDHDPSWTAAAEARDESQDSRASPQQAGLHLPPPVDAGASSPPSGEHGAPVRLAREGAGTGLERIPDSHPRPGFGKDGNRDDAAGGLQDLSGRCLDGPGGRGEPGVSAVSRNGQRLRGDATLCGGRAAFSQASLWGSLGWEADLGPPDARPGAGLAEEPVLCRAVCLRPFPVSAGDQPRGPGSPTEARGGDARLVRQPARPPPGVYPLGRVPSQSGALGEESNER